jgi:broad specificity phosphatase PhoE
MAQQVADTVADRDITHLAASPLERAQETARPLAEARGLEIRTDERLIESTNVFQGAGFGAGSRTLLKPTSWRHLWNPFTPSWGEPYVEIIERMMAAVCEARDTARGHEAVLVSHQLPIWVVRLHAEKRPFLHNPRKRQCTLCSLTSLHFEGDRLHTVTYSEPAGDLIPARARKDPFSAGGAAEPEAPEGHRP